MGNFKYYLELTKPRIGLLVIITAYLGYYIGLRNIDSYMLQSAEWVVLLHLLFGMFLSCSGACVFNQYFEREIDAKMNRTKNRPIPSGLIKSNLALFFGISLSFHDFYCSGKYCLKSSSFFFRSTSLLRSSSKKRCCPPKPDLDAFGLSRLTYFLVITIVQTNRPLPS